MSLDWRKTQNLNDGQLCDLGPFGYLAVYNATPDVPEYGWRATWCSAHGELEWQTERVRDQESARQRAEQQLCVGVAAVSMRNKLGL